MCFRVFKSESILNCLLKFIIPVFAAPALFICDFLTRFFGCGMLPSDFDALCGLATMMALLACKNLKLGKITASKKGSLLVYALAASCALCGGLLDATDAGFALAAAWIG